MALAVPYTREELSRIGVAHERIPHHIAIIMDGNGRWAQSRGLPRIEGHRRGVSSVRRIVEECSRIGIEQLTLYCFSSENWKRPQKELNLLMHLLKQYVIEERSEIMRQGLRFCTIGQTDALSEPIRQEVEKTVSFSCGNSGMRLCLALNYGSRMEVTDAVRTIADKVRSGLLDPDEIDENTISNHLYTAGMIDPDLVIRTAGEMRISNFLLWQISYSELWVTERRWPEFTEADLHTALRDFAGRDRRFGGLCSSSPSCQN